MAAPKKIDTIVVYSLGTECSLWSLDDPVKAIITGIMIDPGPSIQYRCVWFAAKVRYEVWVRACEVKEYCREQHTAQNGDNVFAMRLFIELVGIPEDMIIQDDGTQIVVTDGHTTLCIESGGLGDFYLHGYNVTLPEESKAKDLTRLKKAENHASHTLLQPRDCKCNPDVGSCPICDGGLAYCVICHGGEIDLERQSCCERLVARIKELESLLAIEREHTKDRRQQF